MILRQAFFRDLPGEQQLFDYGVRTDGQPIYAGHTKLGAATSEPTWIMTFCVYNADGSTAKVFCLEGIWDNRVALFAPYAV